MKSKFFNKLVVLLAMGLSLAGCQNKDDGPTVESNRAGVPWAGGTGSPTSPTSTGVQVSGYVTANSTYQSQFQEAVFNLMSTWVPRQYVGYVSSTLENNSGVRFGGQVTMANGAGLQSVGSGSANIHQASRILVQVTDQWPSGQSFSPLPEMYMQNAEGYVQGNYATLRFWDDYRVIYIEGQFDGQNFTGKFRFQNIKSYDGSQIDTRKWLLGDFQVPTCQFFRCN